MAPEMAEMDHGKGDPRGCAAAGHVRRLGRRRCGCDDATTSKGRTFKQAAAEQQIDTATRETPPTSARGKFRCGFSTSDPTRFRSSQPS